MGRGAKTGVGRLGRMGAAIGEIAMAEREWAKRKEDLEAAVKAQRDHQLYMLRMEEKWMQATARKVRYEEMLRMINREQARIATGEAKQFDFNFYLRGFRKLAAQRVREIRAEYRARREQIKKG
jgi:hypothetical protein